MSNVSEIIVVSALNVDVMMANWPPSVQKPMDDDPVQSFVSNPFSHTPIPLALFYFLQSKPESPPKGFSP